MLHRKDIVFSKESIFRPGIESYAEQVSTLPPPESTGVRHQTNVDCPEWADIATTSLQVSFLRMLSTVLHARRVLEIGTFTGHATLGIAATLPEDGEIVTLDNFAADERAREIATTAFKASPWQERIRLVEGDALASLRELAGPFDLIFVDADKPNYHSYYAAILERGLLSPNGLLVFDNTLWGGAVLDTEVTTKPLEDAADGAEWVRLMQADWARHVRDFNSQVAEDDRVEKVLLTVGDGMTLIRLAG